MAQGSDSKCFPGKMFPGKRQIGQRLREVSGKASNSSEAFGPLDRTERKWVAF